MQHVLSTFQITNESVLLSVKETVTEIERGTEIEIMIIETETMKGIETTKEERRDTDQWIETIETIETNTIERE